MFRREIDSLLVDVDADGYKDIVKRGKHGMLDMPQTAGAHILRYYGFKKVRQGCLPRFRCAAQILEKQTSRSGEEARLRVSKSCIGQVHRAICSGRILPRALALGGSRNTRNVPAFCQISVMKRPPLAPLRSASFRRAINFASSTPSTAGCNSSVNRVCPPASSSSIS